MCVRLLLQSWPHTEGACPDLRELDAALQHLKDVTRAVTKEGVRTDRAARLEQVHIYSSTT